MELRLLTPIEIEILQCQGCRCSNWENIKVEPPFAVNRYRNVTFIGSIELRTTIIENFEPVAPYEVGIYNATIVDCTIGSNVHIANVGDQIAHCNIDDNVIIRNVGTITCRPKSKFGEDVVVEVLSETGGREVPLHYLLTAQEAWVIAMCRDNMELVNELRNNIAEEPEFDANRANIGHSAKILNVRIIDSVNIKNLATIEGTSHLFNGTVGRETYVGTDVIASNFILTDHATVDTAARLDHVFVGEGSRVANGFSAHQSLIFSNCILENGEAAALFAGPYTVSMHKSTLLIGCMTLMFNAGSGTNQSNHLYKSGPCHHGIFDRGVKLASDAYIMWPAHIGAFSTVMGRHKSHPDTAALPFSYIVENDGATQVIPAVALGNIGVERDIDKWPLRDKRSHKNLRDIISFDLFNPYIAERITEGIALLKDLFEKQPEADNYQCLGFFIKKRHAERAIELYTKALRHYLLGIMLRRIASQIPLTTANGHGIGHWLDIAGLIIPYEYLKKYPTKSFVVDYSALEWDWVSARLNDQLGINTSNLKNNDISKLIDEWEQLEGFFMKRLRADAQKEFDINTPGLIVGFGLSNPDAKSADFSNVRGTINDSSISRLLNDRIARTNKFLSTLRSTNTFK